MTTTTPTEISVQVRDFCRTINPEAGPKFVPVRVDQGARHGSCYPNIQQKIGRDGGEMLHGWTVWETPDFFLEAEHHAVWVSPDDEWVDITPHEGEDSILFLPDPQRKWEGKPIPNQHLALKDDERLHELLRLFDQADQLKIKYARKDGRPEIPLSEALPLEQRRLQLTQKLGISVQLPPPRALRQMEFRERRPTNPPTSRTGRNDPCPCGSGKKYKKCCLAR